MARAHTDSEDRNTLVLFDVSYEVWIRAFDHWLKAVLPEATYSLRGPLPDGDTERSGDTDEHGDLRERYLPCGEYLLQIGEGEAVVAARLMEEIGAGDGGRGTGSVTWPDAIRVRGVEAPADAPRADETVEPGDPLPEDWNDSRDEHVVLIEPEAKILVEEDAEGADFDEMEEMDELGAWPPAGHGADIFDQELADAEDLAEEP